MKTILGFLLLVFVSVSSCRENGFETASFRCKINGKEFAVKDDMLSISVSGGNNFYIKATCETSPLNDANCGEIKLDFIADSIQKIQLDGSNSWHWSKTGAGTFRSSGTRPGTLNITHLNVEEKRITGTFELSAFADSRTETRSITDGFFDLTW